MEAFKLIASPLPWWALAVVFGSLATKAPLPATWQAWAGCGAAIATGIAGLLTNPQHLMSAMFTKKTHVDG